MDIDFSIKRFEELTNSELYEVLRSRSQVFVVEQNCVYQDIDMKDEKALHVIGIKNHKIIAYIRLFDAGAYFDKASIGRVVVDKHQRTYGYGQELMKHSISGIWNYFGDQPIKISAQCYLKKFYNDLGFIQTGKEYLEDGIPHIAMVMKKNA